MEIMLSHLGVGMAYDALDGLDIHAQRLHLRHIGVAAAVRCEQADIACFFQRYIHLLILRCKILVGNTQTLELHRAGAG